MTWGTPRPTPLSADNIAVFAALSAADAELPWSQRYTAEIQMTKGLLCSADPVIRSIGAHALERLRSKLEPA
jgi:hypothetical protein